MDGAQSANIPLDSGLDINSHDMLVDINNPLFLHNRQKYSGRCLPSSVRFEHDGWAAGTFVYNYKVNGHTVNSSPEGFVISYSTISNIGPVYILTLRDTNDDVVGTITIVRKSVNGQRVSDDELILEDKDAYTNILGELNGKSIALIFDTVTRTITAAEDHSSDIEYTYSVSSGGVLTLVVKDVTDVVDIDIEDIHLAENGYVNADQVIPFISYYDGMHIWQSDKLIFKYDAYSNILEPATVKESQIDFGVTDTVCDDNVLDTSTEIYVTDNIELGIEHKAYIYFFVFNKYTYAYSQDIIDSNKEYVQWQATNIGVVGAEKAISSNYMYCNDTADDIAANGERVDYQDQLLEVQVPVWGSISIANTIVAKSLPAKKFDPLSIDIYAYDAGDDAIVRVGGATIINNNSEMACGSSWPTLFNIRHYEATVQATMYVNSEDLPIQVPINVPTNTDTIAVPWTVDLYIPDGDGSDDVDTFVRTESGVVHIPAAALYAFHLATGSHVYSFTVSVRYRGGTDGEDIDGNENYYIVQGTNTITVEDIHLLGFKQANATTTIDITEADEPFFAGTKLNAKVSGNSVTLLSYTLPNDAVYRGSAKDYESTDTGDRIPANMLSICRNCLASVIVRLTESPSTLSNISNAFIRKYVRAETALEYTRPDRVYIDRGEDLQGNPNYDWFTLSVTPMQSGDNVQFDLKLVPKNTDVLYAYTGMSGVRVPALDPDGLQRFEVRKLSVSDVCTISVKALMNNGYDIGALRNITPVYNMTTLGVDTIDALYTKLHTLRFRTGAHSGKFVFANDDHTNGRVEFSQPVHIRLPNGTELQFTHDGYIDTMAWLQPFNVTVDDTTFELIPDDTGVVKLYSYTPFTLLFRAILAKCTDDNFALESAYGNTAATVTSIIDDEPYSVTYMGGSATVDHGNTVTVIPADSVRTEGTKVTIIYDYIPAYTYAAIPKQVIRSSNVEPVSLTYDTIAFKYKGTTYTADVSDTGLFLPNVASTLTYTSVDVRDKESIVKDICTVATDDAMQFVRQAWDTVSSTEQFWWLNSDTYLRLTPTELIRMRREYTLHDWNGDDWVEDAKWPRPSIISLNAAQYLCSNAYDDATPLLLTLVDVSSDTIALIAHDPLSAMTQPKFTIDITLKCSSIGSKLNVTSAGASAITLYSYDIINAHDLCSKATLSATCVDGKLIFGIHYNNNFNQWAIIVDTVSKRCTQIQGYGYVGVNGCLTGGEIPATCFDVQSGGFTGAVMPLSTLNSDKVSVNENDITTSRNIVVGDSTQQWYLFNDVRGIVSHIEYADGKFTPVTLHISNKYTALYKSGSTSGYNYEPMNIKREDGNSIGSSGKWGFLLSFLGQPGIYYSNPVSLAVAYLQQTLVQAAYVHYNSTALHKTVDIATSSDDAKRNPTTAVDLGDKINPLSSDTLSFDTVILTQKTAVPAATGYNNTTQLFLSMLTASADSFIQSELQVNGVVNMSTSEDTCKQYGQMFAWNTVAATISSIYTKSVDPGLTSQVVAIKSLDMYYSTSDGQKVQAGPGFVNHAFVAQCTAQSVTSIQYESYARALTTLYPGLSMAECTAAFMVYKGIYNMAEKMLIANTAPSTTGGLSFQASPGYIAALIAGGVAGAAMTVAETFDRNLNAFLETVRALAANGPTSTLLGQASTHQYNIEGAHKYGSRSEQFMWPCFDCEDVTMPDETVECGVTTTPVKLPYQYTNTLERGPGVSSRDIDYVTNELNSSLRGGNLELNYYTGMIKGKAEERALPADMACVIGTSDFLPKTLFKNENIGESEPVFTAPLIHDYVIDKRWALGLTSPGYGGVAWVSCKDTKVIDGAPSNIVVSDSFCGVASAYAAIEIKRGIDPRYVRPWTTTPQALLFNHTGLNCCYDNEVVHACDGYGYRLIKWIGAAGMHKENMALLYSYIQNQRFKTSNKLPPNQFLGNFKAEPITALDTSGNKDKLFTLLTQPAAGKGLTAGKIGEDKDLIRYSIPIFTEQVSLLPAAVKTYSGYTLAVAEGITGLVTDLRTDMQGYKVPISEDFTINDVLYRITSEYICKVTNDNGVSTMDKMVPVIGLRFLGATPHEAFFYSQDSRQYYVYSGGDRLNAVDTTERFRDIVHGLYDFINQEVVVPALATFNRLDKFVLDDADETDNVIVPRLKQQQFIGEVWPPLNTIYNTRSWYRLMSLPTGIVYQGPNRCIINQFIVSDYMIPGILRNKGKWQRVPREQYNPIRKYPAIYESVHDQLGNDGVRGWTHNPFLLVTAPLGLNQETDCLFEWVITFCWTVDMDKIIGPNEYVCVNITSETMSPGGKKVAERPTHVFLCKELFTRSDNYGYYSFRFSGQTGAGNRERLHIWSDGYIAISAVNVEYKPITSRRNEILTQQVDVIGRLVEM